MGKFLFGGVIIVTIFMLIARPITVILCALPDRRAKWSFKEMLFMSWTRETGVIPAALAGLLMGKHVPRCRNHSCRYIYRYPYDYPNPGYYCEVAGRKIGIAGISIKASCSLANVMIKQLLSCYPWDNGPKFSGYFHLYAIWQGPGRCRIDGSEMTWKCLSPNTVSHISKS